MASNRLQRAELMRKSLGKLEIPERIMMLVGFFIILVGFFIYLPWGNKLPDFQIIVLHPASYNTTPPPHADVMTTEPSFLDLTNTTFQPTNVTKHVEPVGCNPDHKWCLYTPKTYLSQFLVASALVSIGYPIVFVIANTLFSKILGPKPQGTMMGILTAAGSLARTVGPVYVGWAYNSYGVRLAYGTAAGVVVSAMIVFVIFYRRLVPFGTPIRSSCCARP